MLMQTASEIASEMGLQGKVADDFKNILVKLSKLTVEKEAELAEINPLAILDDGRMVALDGKMVTDDNSGLVLSIKDWLVLVLGSLQLLVRAVVALLDLQYFQYSVWQAVLPHHF